MSTYPWSPGRWSPGLGHEKAVALAIRTALQAIFERNTTLCQRYLDLQAAPGRRVVTFPVSRVFDIARRIGQFDLTAEEVHEIWLKLRMLGCAEVRGVALEVSAIDSKGKVTTARVA